MADRDTRERLMAAADQMLYAVDRLLRPPLGWDELDRAAVLLSAAARAVAAASVLPETAPAVDPVEPT